MLRISLEPLEQWDCVCCELSQMRRPCGVRVRWVLTPDLRHYYLYDLRLSRSSSHTTTLIRGNAKLAGLVAQCFVYGLTPPHTMKGVQGTQKFVRILIRKNRKAISIRITRVFPWTQNTPIYQKKPWETPREQSAFQLLQYAIFWAVVDDRRTAFCLLRRFSASHSRLNGKSYISNGMATTITGNKMKDMGIIFGGLHQITAGH